MGAHGWEWAYLWPPFHGNHGGSEAAVMSRGTTFHSHPQVCTSPSHPLNPQKTSINKSGSQRTRHWTLAVLHGNQSTFITTPDTDWTL